MSEVINTAYNNALKCAFTVLGIKRHWVIGVAETMVIIDNSEWQWKNDMQIYCIMNTSKTEENIDLVSDSSSDLTFIHTELCINVCG